MICDIPQWTGAGCLLDYVLRQVLSCVSCPMLLSWLCHYYVLCTDLSYQWHSLWSWHAGLLCCPCLVMDRRFLSSHVFVSKCRPTKR